MSSLLSKKCLEPYGSKKVKIKKLEISRPAAGFLPSRGPVFPYVFPYAPKLAFMKSSMRAALSCLMRSVK